MSEETNQASANAGSANGTGNNGSGNAGETGMPDLSDYVPKAQYEELEKKLGEQGRELGGLRDLFTDFKPIFDKMDEAPMIARAIASGKLDANLAQAILDGKVTAAEAKQVSQAHEEVKKELGAKEYAKIDPVDLENKILERLTPRLESIKKDVTSVIETDRALREAERNDLDFIAKTPDFQDYADEILKYVDEHEDADNLEDVYNRIKSRAIVQREAEAKKAGTAEEAKSAALMASGGQGQRSGVISDPNILDQLIRVGNNPNRLDI